LDSSCSSRPAGVAMCARDGAGMEAGTAMDPGGCHGPGSKNTASSTPWMQRLTLVHLSAQRKRFWWNKGHLGGV
jgi:hypothetical protein